MMMMNRRTALFAPTALLAACAAPDVTEYAGERPLLDLRAYFDGRVDGTGLFTDRSGKVVKRFEVRMDCRWTGEEGVLDEDFTYSDGSKQRRIWRLRQLGGGRFRGEADDVIGVADGLSSGNAFRWRYTLALPVDGRTWHVDMDDWMYLMPSGVLLNRTTMTKFGVRLGEVMLSFRKPA